MILINGEFYQNIKHNGVETIYFINKEGKVVSYKNGNMHVLKVFETKTSRKSKKHKKGKTQGYLYVKLWINGKTKAKFISRLVAEYYIPNPDNKPEVNHIDGNHYNNSYTNLEWVSRKENIYHAKINNLYDPALCEENGNAKYTNKQIEKCCILISENKLTIPEISKKSGIDIDTVYNIRSKRTYKTISSKFHFDEPIYISKYSDDVLETACILKLQGYSTSNISSILGVNRSTLNDVFKGRRHKKLYKKYFKI